MTSATQLPPALAAQAARQGGLFTRAQALADGYPDSSIGTLLNAGRWRAIRPGVYCDSSLATRLGANRPGSFLLDARAAVLDLGAVASHETAAFLLGMSDRVPGVVTVTRAGRGSSRASGDVVIHRAALPGGHMTVARQTAVTSAARTVADLARSRRFRDAVVVADAALRLRGTTKTGLAQVLADCAGWPGVAAARRAAAFADGRAESPLESIGRVVFAEYGLPPPVLQAVIDLGDGESARVDFLWEAHATIAEADGMLKYTSADVLYKEKLRQEALERLGYQVVRFTWRDLRDDPVGVVARIQAAFARAHASVRAVDAETAHR